MSQMSLPLITLAGSEGKAVKSGYLSFQYGILGNKEVKLYTKWRSNNAFCASGNRAVCFVTGSCWHSIVRGTLILIRSLSFRVFTYRLSCCIPERLVRLSNCKLQDEERCKIAATQPSETVCLYACIKTIKKKMNRHCSQPEKKIEPMLSYRCKLVKEALVMN